MTVAVVAVTVVVSAVAIGKHAQVMPGKQYDRRTDDDDAAATN